MNPIDEAAQYLHLTKLQEQKATEERIKAEQALIALVPAKDKGSVMLKGESYKVTIAYGKNVTIDEAVLSVVKADVPSAMFEQAIRYKAAVIDRGLAFLAANEPDTFAKLAQAITSKPAKPSVKLEQLAMQEAAA